jgi:hypothetical protein
MQNKIQDGVSFFRTSIFDNVVLPSQIFNCSVQDGVISSDAVDFNSRTKTREESRAANYG